jgi:hypothetical protein
VALEANATGEGVFKVTFIVFTCIVGVSVVLLAILWGATLPARLHAQKVLDAVAALEPGQSTFEEAQRLAKGYGAEANASVSGEGVCSRQLCEFSFPFANTPLAFLPGVKRVSFGANVSVRAGRVTSVAVAYQRMADRIPDVPDEAQYLYGVLNDAARNENEYGPKKENPGTDGIPRLVLYRLGPRSTQADRAKAFSLDLSCLDSFVGCGGPSAIYPPGWQSW